MGFFLTSTEHNKQLLLLCFFVFHRVLGIFFLNHSRTFFFLSGSEGFTSPLPLIVVRQKKKNCVSSLRIVTWRCLGLELLQYNEDGLFRFDFNQENKDDVVCENNLKRDLNEKINNLTIQVLSKTFKNAIFSRSSYFRNLF